MGTRSFVMDKNTPKIFTSWNDRKPTDLNSSEREQARADVRKWFQGMDAGTICSGALTKFIQGVEHTR